MSHTATEKLSSWFALTSHGNHTNFSMDVYESIARAACTVDTNIIRNSSDCDDTAALFFFCIVVQMTS